MPNLKVEGHRKIRKYIMVPDVNVQERNNIYMKVVRII
jgi:hypothetical protein